jgi:glycosyltransferase involved in cell wall biosynthesis
VAANLRAVEPRFAGARFAVIPHGIAPGPDCFGGAETGRRLRVVMLGRLEPEKGSDHFAALFPALQACVDLHLLGAGPAGRAFQRRSHVEVVERYAHGDLTGLLARIRPDLALILSIVPETFSYTLSETAAHGIPACARPVGAFVDRIEPGRTGFFFPPDPQGPLRLLLGLDADRDAVRAVHRALVAGPHRGVAEMIDDYYAERDDYPAAVAAALA